MKKLSAILLAAAVCLCIFTACGKKEEPLIDSGDKIVPTQAPEMETAKTEDDIFGAFESDGYSATIEAGESGLVLVTIKGKTEENKSSEWVINGYFSEGNNLINYINAVKYEITYDRTGAEKKRETVYDNGAGRILFASPDDFIWKNSSEFIEDGSEFTRTK